MKILFKFTVLLLIFSGIFSCSPLKRLKEGEVLLNKNIIKNNKPELNDGIRPILKQKPNRRILGIFRFHLGVYALADRENDQSKFRNWIKNTIGEKPVLLDSNLTHKSTRQIKQFLNNSGYFNAEVSDTTIFKKRKRANVYYTIKTGSPYYISNYAVETKDRYIRNLLSKDSLNYLIKNGNALDGNVLQKERDRVTNLLKNEGYYYFSQAYIRFDADSTNPNRSVNLKMVISRINENAVDSARDIFPSDHIRYHINNVYIHTDYYPLTNYTNVLFDTLVYKDYFFLTSTDKIKIKPEIILRHILQKKGELYKISNLENTYKLLGGLNVFKFVNIKFEPIPNDSNARKPWLNCFINITPGASQEHHEEIVGTNNGGALGIAGNISYLNRNFLRGAELFEIKLKGGVESIKSFSDNIYEIGPEVNLSFPKLIFPKKILPKKLRHESFYSNEYTTLTANFNLQKRPEYNRTIANFSLQWFTNETPAKSHFIFPAEINFVNVDVYTEFQNKLSELNDSYLNYTYSNHLITDGRWSYFINTQNVTKLNNFYFFRLNLEFAGNSLWVLSHVLKSQQYRNNSYQIFNTPFAQYVKPDMDFRYYHILNENNTLVYRAAGGIGVPYLNSSYLPFEKAFFAGGSNDLRAFRARAVGPGSLDTNKIGDQTGEIKLNANIEFRFDIFKILQGAAFVDAGNIWLIKPDKNRPGANFRSNYFLNEFAIGGGIGARLNFTFFIIRLDVGVPFKNPSLPPGKRWVINKPSLISTVFNLGIGYPF